jgi:hypothetical protein
MLKKKKKLKKNDSDFYTIAKILSYIMGLLCRYANYTCYSVNFQRNKAFVGLSDCRTVGLSDCWTIGLSDYRSDPMVCIKPPDMSITEKMIQIFIRSQKF